MEIFEEELDRQMATWRDALPPSHLQTRIRETLARDRKPRKRVARIWGGSAFVAVATLGAIAFVPGSLTRPTPAFADVEHAMEAVNSFSCVFTSRCQYSDRPSDSDTQQIWVCKKPLAIAWQDCIRLDQGKILQRVRSFATSGNEIVKDELSGKVRIIKNKRDISHDINTYIFGATQPGRDGPHEGGANYDRTAWKLDYALLRGKRVWHFTRTERAAVPPKAVVTEVTQIQVWADPQTHRIVQAETVMVNFHQDTGRFTREWRTSQTDCQYNEPMPAWASELYAKRNSVQKSNARR